MPNPSNHPLPALHRHRYREKRLPTELASFLMLRRPQCQHQRNEGNEMKPEEIDAAADAPMKHQRHERHGRHGKLLANEFQLLLKK